MAGFYGNISASNKTAFTFDHIYPNRKSMDEAIQNKEDGIFIGRYVLVDYHQNPNKGNTFNNSNQEANNETDYTTQEIICGYYANNTFYKDAHYRPGFTLTPQDGRIYQDLAAINTDSSFYKCTQVDEENFIYELITNPSEMYYITNYNADIEVYGGTYDCTVWMKHIDVNSNAYRYILIAKLNTKIPTFHLIIDPPSGSPYGPYFDRNTTDLDYHMHFMGPFGVRMNVLNSNIQNENGLVVSDSYASNIYTRYDETTYTYDTYTVENETADIYFNKAGFNAKRSVHDDITANNISYILAQSDQKYYGESNTGVKKQDTMCWYIHLPIIGNVIATVWDKMFTANRTASADPESENYQVLMDQILDESWDNRISCTVDTNSIMGLTNSTRCYLGKMERLNSSIISDHAGLVDPDHPEQHSINEDNEFYLLSTREGNVNSRYYNKAIIFTDNGENERHYYIPSFTNIWTEDQNGEYYRAKDGSYRLANKQALVASMCYGDVLTYYSRETGTQNGSYLRYTESFVGDSTKLLNGEAAAQSENEAEYIQTSPITEMIAGNISGEGYNAWYQESSLVNSEASNPHTIYGSIALINKLLGIKLSKEDSRDDRTVVGMINIMKDVVANIDTQLTPNRWLKTAANGQITTSSVVFKEQAEVQTVHGVTYRTLLSTSGDWDSRFAEINVTTATSNATTELTATEGAIISICDHTNALKDSRVNFLTGNKWIRLAADNTNKNITFAHALCGIDAATLTPTATGWGSAATNSNDNEIVFPTITFDAAGHITGHSTTTFYLPHSFKTISIAEQSTSSANSTGNTTSVVADNSADTIQLATANKWLTIAGNNNSIAFGHIVSGVASGTYGQGSTLTISLSNGGQFDIPQIKIDAAGHITEASNIAVKINSLPNIGTMKLTGYTTIESNDNNIYSTDTLNTALAKIEARLANLES